MSSFHTLTIVKDLTALPYEERVKANDALKRLIMQHGLLHTAGRHEEAAKALSLNSLVERVHITHVTEVAAGTFRKGKKS